jgi:hypothetical protein
MAEKRFKDAVRLALTGLLLPPLQEIVCDYVEVTVLKTWMENRAFWYAGNYSLMTTDSPNIISWRLADHDARYPLHVRVKGNGPWINASFDAIEIDKMARQFKPHDKVVFTFTDSKNWSLDLND